MKRKVERTARYASGRIARRYTCDPRTDKLEGVYRSWYDDGQPELVAAFKNGKPHGEWTEWYSNGQMRKHGYYRDGNPQGTYEEWWENGNRLRLSTYRKDGTGEFTHWNEDGTLNYRGEVDKAGKLNITEDNFLTYEKIARQ